MFSLHPHQKENKQKTKQDTHKIKQEKKNNNNKQTNKNIHNKEETFIDTRAPEFHV